MNMADNHNFFGVVVTPSEANLSLIIDICSEFHISNVDFRVLNGFHAVFFVNELDFQFVMFILIVNHVPCCDFFTLNDVN